MRATTGFVFSTAFWILLANLALVAVVVICSTGCAQCGAPCNPAGAICNLDLREGLLEIGAPPPVPAVQPGVDDEEDDEDLDE